jgi:arginyl-tRNA synthetase
MKKIHGIASPINRDVHEQLVSLSKKRADHPPIDTYFFVRLKHQICTAVQSINASCTMDDIKLSVTPPSIDGDVTLDVFYLGKQLRKNPLQLGESVVAELCKLAVIENAFSIRGYVNFYLNKSQVMYEISNEIRALGPNYGQSNENVGRVAILDFSGPNIAKPIGVGHLRSTIIGQSLANLYDCVGYTTLKINHIGDWGTQFGALIEAFDTWNSPTEFEKNPIQALKSLYVKFHAEKKTNPALEEAARNRFLRLEKKQSPEFDLWQQFRDLSIASFEAVYRQFNVRFDAYQGESFFSDHIETVLDTVTAQKLCQQEDGTNAIVVNGLNGVPTFLIQKEDGASLYITRDLAALMYRAESFAPDTVLYVVGNEQSLHFKQLFALYNAMDHHHISQLHHIGFGLILTDGKKMSTRDGSLIELNELVLKAKEKVSEILKEKGNYLPDEAIHTIAVGAIIYNDLSRSRTKNIDFNWDTMLSMDCGSSVYLQYTYARLGAICRKLNDSHGPLVQESPIADDIVNADEMALALKLMFFKPTIAQAKATNMPNVLSAYLDELAQQANTYYAKYRIIDSENKQLIMRYALLECIRHVLKNGLRLLNIDTLEKM